MPDTDELIAEETVEGQKHSDMVEAYKPYGGATSFSEIDDQKAIQDYAVLVENETYALRSIIENITNEVDFNSDEKAAAIQDAATEYRKRVNAIQVAAKAASQKDNSLNFWQRIKSKMEGLSGDKEAPTVKKAASPQKFMPENRGFKVYRDKAGDLRWLSLSSNAFEDLDRELFTTKALEEAIEHADETGERGPLLVYHVPSAKIGQCDFQAMAGRFLVESGTFDDTPLGSKAVEYFVDSDEEHQVSIGFEYRAGDEEDGVYDWARIIERSVTPYGAAANPWTDFKVIGENPMDARKVATLEKIFGSELSAQVIASAEEKTKELEASVAFKTKTETEDKAAPAAMQAAYDKMPVGPDKDAMKKKIDAMKELGEKADVKEEESKEEVVESKTVSFGTEQLSQLATLITDLSEQVEGLSGLKTIVEELQTEVKDLKRSEDEKISDIMTPRWSFPGGIRPTESAKNVVTDEKEIENLNNEAGDQPTNPAQAYVDDLLGRNGRVRVG